MAGVSDFIAFPLVGEYRVARRVQHRNVDSIEPKDHDLVWHKVGSSKAMLGWGYAVD
jgi:hypothetical protein